MPTAGWPRDDICRLENGAHFDAVDEARRFI